MAKHSHPLEKLFGDGIITGLVLYATFRWVIRPIGRGIAHLGWRWRRVLTPLWFATAVELVALIWRAGAAWTWWAALVLPALGTTAAVLGPRFSGFWARLVLAVVPDSVDAGRKGVLDRVPERLYVALFTAALGGWLALRVGTGPSVLTQDWWLGGTLAFGGTWWYHRRIRVAGRADRYARRWRKLADKETGPVRELVGSKVVEARGTKRQAVLTVRLAAGVTAMMLGAHLDRVASFYSLRPGAVYLSQDETNARRVRLRFLPGDPWKGAIPHPMLEPGSYSYASTGGVIAMGLYADGNEEEYTLQHTLVVGASGSGKSIWLRALMIWLTGMSDMHIVAGDMAGGATLKAWEPCLSRPLATDYDSTVVMLEAVMAWIEDRERQLADNSLTDNGEDVIRATDDTPALAVVIDEYPDWVAEAKTRGKTGEKHLALIGRIGKRIRKCNGKLILLCQNGSKEDTGSKELQAQLTAVVGLMLDQHADTVLWGTLNRKGWQSSLLRTGQHLLRDPQHTTPNPAKGFYTKQREANAYIAKASQLHKRMEPTAWAALQGLEAPMVVPAEPEGTKDEVLAALEIHPASVEDLVVRTGLSRATVYRRLARLRADERVRKDADVWVCVRADERVSA